MSGESGYKDNFSAVAGGYSRHRPAYPDALFDWIASVAPRREAAWDCACGNGQASIGLAAHFDHVRATDASAQQIEQAAPHAKITYGVAAAEHTPFEDDSFDLILVAQAAHWFDFHAFFAEVKRVGRRDGVLALAAYELHRVTPEIDAITDQFYEPVLGGYWQPERRHIKAGYRDIPFPFADIATPDLFMTAEWTVEACAGYLNTWSSVSRCRKETGKDPLEGFIAPMRAAWGEGARTVRWPLILRAGRIAA